MYMKRVAGCQQSTLFFYPSGCRYSDNWPTPFTSKWAQSRKSSWGSKAPQNCRSKENKTIYQDLSAVQTLILFTSATVFAVKYSAGDGFDIVDGAKIAGFAEVLKQKRAQLLIHQFPYPIAFC